MKGNPVTGFNYLMQGFGMITRPGLRLFVVVPLLVNTVIFAALIGFTIDQIGEWITGFINWIPGWLDFLRWILWPLAVILVLVVVMYTFSIVANFIAAPFNGLLAEKAEELLTGTEVPALETLSQALIAFPRAITREIAKILYYLPLALGVLILSLIPGINAAAPLLWFALGAWMMVIQYCDFPMDNNGKKFGVMKRAIRAKRLTSYGFGASVMVGTMIPILNFLIMPAAVCGATVYWVEELKKASSDVGGRTSDA